MALEALPRYDGKHSLHNFLYVHVRNRLTNFQRKNLFRPEPACSTCPLYDKVKDLCLAFSERDECPKWTNWKEYNENKKSLMCIESLDNPQSILDPNTTEVLDDVTRREMLEHIDRSIPMAIRSDFKRMLDGVVLSKARRDNVRQAIIKCLQEEVNDV